MEPVAFQSKILRAILRSLYLLTIGFADGFVKRAKMLDYVALFVIFFLICSVAAVIVALGSLPGKIARKRDHPWADAVNVASWIGLATGVFWPIAFIWAYLPVPIPNGRATTGSTGSDAELNSLQAKLSALEETVAKLQSQSGGGTA